MKILIIVAMKSELEGFLNEREYETILVNGIPTHFALINNHKVYIAKSEVGKVNAACLTTALALKIKPQFIINAGIAGGLNSSINLLDVICSSKIAYHDFDLTSFGYLKGELDDGTRFFKGSLKLMKLLPDDVKRGLIVSGDQFVSGIDKLNEIKKDFPKALACDMEGCPIAHVATLLNRKFLVIRCISDNVFLENHTKVYQDHKPEAIKKVVKYTISMINSLN